MCSRRAPRRSHRRHDKDTSEHRTRPLIGTSTAPMSMPPSFRCRCSWNRSGAHSSTRAARWSPASAPPRPCSRASAPRLLAVRRRGRTAEASTGAGVETSDRTPGVSRGRLPPPDRLHPTDRRRGKKSGRRPFHLNLMARLSPKTSASGAGPRRRRRQEFDIRTKRVYEPAAPTDGLRVLVDRIWPRGLRREQVRADLWLKAAAPSTALRQWFAHDPAKWLGFKRRYFAELDARADALAPLLQAARQQRVTLLFSAADERHNQAVALREYLLARLRRASRAAVQQSPRKSPLTSGARRTPRVAGLGSRRSTRTRRRR